MLQFCFLDLISSVKRLTGRGIGEAIYNRVRQKAISLKAAGIFMECLPDHPRLCPVPELLKENAARLKFYELRGPAHHGNRIRNPGHG